MAGERQPQRGGNGQVVTEVDPKRIEIKPRPFGAPLDLQPKRHCWSRRRRPRDADIRQLDRLQSDGRCRQEATDCTFLTDRAGPHLEARLQDFRLLQEARPRRELHHRKRRHGPQVVRIEQPEQALRVLGQLVVEPLSHATNQECETLE